MTRDAMVMVGNSGVEHVGNHLHSAAQSLEIPVRFCDSGSAYRAPAFLARLNWWLRGHRPSRLAGFSEEVVSACLQSNAGLLLTTGLAPFDAGSLEKVGRSGVVRINFLTDDPFNPQHSAAWFMDALPRYDIVFSPRKANIEDLRKAGCINVVYLPFGFAPDIHFPEPPVTPEEQRRYSADMVFAGGADAERIPFITALLRDKVNVALYGGYWSRYAETRSANLGYADPETLRKAVSGARIALCLVRRANRDGHAMRTWELAAMGACILAEDTDEHREILGHDGVSAFYFRSIPEMLERAQALLKDDELRTRAGAAVRARICNAGNTYRDRLESMLRIAGHPSGREQ